MGTWSERWNTGMSDVAMAHGWLPHFTDAHAFPASNSEPYTGPRSIRKMPIQVREDCWWKRVSDHIIESRSFQFLKVGSLCGCLDGNEKISLWQITTQILKNACGPAP